MFVIEYFPRRDSLMIPSDSNLRKIAERLSGIGYSVNWKYAA